MSVSAAQAISPGDLAAYLMLGVVTAGQVAGWVASILKATRGAVKEGAAEASAGAAEMAEVKSVAGELARVATALEDEVRRSTDRAIDCAGWRARIEEIVKQLADGQATMARTQEGLQRQITNVALRLAPSDAVTLPLNTTRRR
jgi:hypothetical protein